MAVQQITPREAQALMEQDPQVVYLDVRTVAEFAAGHPQRALNIPVVFFDAAQRPIPNPDFLTVVEANIPKDTQIIVGCQAGMRSQRAADILAQAGYTRVANMQGGFGGARDQTGRVIVPGWQECGLPVSTDNGEGVSYASLAAKAGVAV
ncbi:MAG: rhodanese-like domain-containing protein [Candidatus Binatia bacterium]|nr:rhodanese-like domain-containing protein [Candidatus Binatia bacterium]